MNKENIFKETDLGFIAQMSGYDVFFGKGSSTLDDLQTCFSQDTFRSLKQVHGCKLVEATEKVVESDAHWSQKRNEALLIQTADCLPVMICHPEFICAIHAGWRGVMSNIIGRSLSSLAGKFGDLNSAKVFIGPHIHQKSFQVDMKLAIEFQHLAQNYSIQDPVFYSDPNAPEQKAFVDLIRIAKGQMVSNRINEALIFDIGINTVENLSFQSYRRGKATSGRNLSFVTRRSEPH